MSAANDSKGFGLWTSTIMLKVIMALTGAGMAAFVLGHMVGHLQMFLGRDAYNAYAEFLQHGMGKLIWVARLGLIGILGAHIAVAAKLTQMNQAARPRDYARALESRRTSPAAKYMVFSGVVIALFIAYHLAHFTLGIIHPEYYGLVDPMGRHDVYNNFVYSFQSPMIVGTYVVANVALAMHLSHSMTSMFKTLGLAEGRFRAPFEMVGPLFAGLCLVGFLIPPLACVAGAIEPEYDAGESAPTAMDAASHDAGGAGH